ncbi:alpha/beta hydrolase [Nitrospira lenta]|uniref:Putative Carboxylesterase n=1 Tax=Nitrospira lenta TaxID=1436998 RepID=A0A330L419_9BACT|nr:esterase [Nitrospira lenta]SPP64558.1 putative Carboxylesterase [Nitrospira lenta]
MREEQISGLRTRITGGTDGKGGGRGPLVLLLHGFGAPGDDLVPLADALSVPAGTRFVFPEGPLSLSFGPGNARAWWLIDMARLAQDRAAGRVRDLSQDIPKGLAPVRETMLSFLKEIEQRFDADPKKTVLGGFSQGAMLSCDLMLHTDRPYAGLVQLSGTLLAQPIWGPLLPKRKGLPVFQSHGVQDEILPYAGAERLRDTLAHAGLSVEWHNFRGGHEIPRVVLQRLGPFITKAATST